MAAYLEGRWKIGLELTDRAGEVLRDQCTGAAWEINTARCFSLWSLTRMGEFAELGERWPELIREGRDRGNNYIGVNAMTYMMCMLKLREGDVVGAGTALGHIMAQWTYKGCHVQHNEGTAAEVEVELYRGEAATAWDRIDRYWPRLESSLLLRVQIIRIVMGHLRARCALAAAASSAVPRSLLRLAGREVRHLRSERTPYAEAMALLIHAGIAMQRGDDDVAAEQLENAVARFDAVDIPLYAATARRRLGETLGGGKGQELVAKADAWMTSQGIREPARMAAVFAPGFRD
jgi:hypothetical protein